VEPIEARALVRRYVDAWNESDVGRRRQQLDALYADQARVVTQSESCTGRDALVAHVTAVADEYLDSRGGRFRATGLVSHHDAILMRWELVDRASGEPVDAGVNLLLLGGDSTIVSDHQFVLGLDASLGASGHEAAP
jgi:hypothetical protein